MKTLPMAPPAPLAKALAGLSLTLLCALAPAAHGQIFGGDSAPGKKLEFPVAPQFTPARYENGHPMIVREDDLEREVRKHSPFIVAFWAPHQERIVVDAKWTGGMVDWYADMLSDFNVKYVAETWDCDKYAQFMVVQMTLAMIKYWRADVRVPVGWMSVSQEVAWGGVQQGGGKHAVVLVRTDKGLEVIEPQTGDRVPLAKYPNRHRILQVFFQ